MEAKDLNLPTSPASGFSINLDSTTAAYSNWPPIPGYTIVRPLGRGGFGEVFQAEAPGGFAKAVKFVRLSDSNPLSARELESLEIVKTIRHPFLLSIDRVDVHDEHIAILMELADGSLHDEFSLARNQGSRGIERGRLLALLTEAAEALDFLYTVHGVQHLDVKPGNLFLVAGHLKVGDFGLLRKAEGERLERRFNAVSPNYAAPEVFDGCVNRTCDQYSLAIVFMEMLTGLRPYSGENVRTIAYQQLTAGPNLEVLSVSERRVLMRALSLNPQERFDSCVAMIESLRNATPSAVPALEPVETGLASVDTTRVSDHGSVSLPLDGGILSQRTAVPNPLEVVPSLTSMIFAGEGEPFGESVWRNFLVPGNMSKIYERLQAFAKHAGMRLNECGSNRAVLQRTAKPTWYRPFCNEGEAVLIQLWFSQRVESPGRIAVQVQVCSGDPNLVADRFAKVAEEQLRSLRKYLTASHHQEPLRRFARRPSNGTLLLLGPHGGDGDVSVADIVDRSVSGVGVVLSNPIEVGTIQIRLPEMIEPSDAKVVYCWAVGEEQYRVGISLVSSTEHEDSLP